MSWIKDVAHEIKQLDVTRKSLRKFGLVIGMVFVLLGLLFVWKEILVDFNFGFVVFGLLLILTGLIAPSNLKTIYKIWMGFAFALGWIVSRFILLILFIFVLTPIGLLAKLFGKKFMTLHFNKDAESYWIIKQNKKIDYEKMY